MLKPRQPLTPAMMRTCYHEHRIDPRPPIDPSRLPVIDSEPDEVSTADWLAHIAAGRIELR